MLLDTQITLGTVVLVEHFPESETNLSSIAMQEPDELLLESSQLVSKVIIMVLFDEFTGRYVLR